MDDREIPRDDLTHPRERMNEVAHELARRAKPSYLKDRAKEKVKEGAIKAKDRTIDSPIALGILGGLAAFTAAKLFKARRERHAYEPWMASEVPWEEEQHGFQDTFKTKAGEMKEEVRIKAEAAKEKARETFVAAKEGVVAAKDRIADQSPFLLGLGCVAVGAALAYLIPVGEKERSFVSPYKRQMTDKLEDKLHVRTNGGTQIEPPLPPTPTTYPV